MLLLVVLLLLPVPSMAATYYVATTGNDTTGDGSIGTPWRTVQKAANTVVAGDTVNVRAGNYQEYVTMPSSRNGTVDNRITFQSYPGETAVIDGSLVSAPTTFSFLVRISGDYITFRNFEVVHSAWMGILLDSTSTNLIIEGNTVHHTYRAAVAVYRSPNAIVRYNTIYDAYDIVTGGQNADCLVNTDDGAGWTANGQWYGNVVHDCSDDGIDAWQGANTVITDNISYHNGYIPFTETAAGDGNGFKLGPGGGNTVVDNIAWNNRVRGYDDNTGPNDLIYNNTAINSGVNYRVTNGTGAILKNNISSSGSVSIGTGATLETNSWNIPVTPTYVQITDPTLSTFAELDSGSPAIGVGTTVAGNTHNCIDTCDLGAKEFNSGGPEPSGPQGTQPFSPLINIH